MGTVKKIGSKLYAGWMAFARILAVVNTTIILSLVYLLLIGPTALVMRVLGKDLLNRRWHDGASYWRAKEELKHTMDESRHQF